MVPPSDLSMPAISAAAVVSTSSIATSGHDSFASHAYAAARTRSIDSRSSGQPRVRRIAMSAAQPTRSRSTAATLGAGRARGASQSTSDQCGSCELVEARAGRLPDTSGAETEDIETPLARAQGAAVARLRERYGDSGADAAWTCERRSTGRERGAPCAGSWGKEDRGQPDT